MHIADGPSAYTFEENFIIRFPASVANILREEIKENSCPGNLSIKFTDTRHAIVTYNERSFSALLVDLPSIIESHKTLDHAQYYKTADIHQMLIIFDPDATESKGFCSQIETDFQFQWPDGITPPLKNVRIRRFGHESFQGQLGSGPSIKGREATTLALEEIENAVQKLVDADDSAHESHFTLYDSSNRAILGSSNINTSSRSFSHGSNIFKDLVSAPLSGSFDSSTRDDANAISNRNDGLNSSNEDNDEDYEDLAEEIECNLMNIFPKERNFFSSPENVTENAKITNQSVAIQNLQFQLQEKQKQLSLVTNPMIKARLEEIVRQLEQEILNKLS